MSQSDVSVKDVPLGSGHDARCGPARPLLAVRCGADTARLGRVRGTAILIAVTSAVACAVLTVSSADLVRRTARANSAAGAALAPYALWCGFATVLLTAIATRNPGRSA